MRDGGDDRIVDTHTHKSNYSDRERKERERAKSESRERMNTVSLRSFCMKKLFVAKSEEIIMMVIRKKRTAMAIYKAR